MTLHATTFTSALSQKVQAPPGGRLHDDGQCRTYINGEHRPDPAAQGDFFKIVTGVSARSSSLAQAGHDLEVTQRPPKMPSLDEIYPQDCPFCNIAKAYPPEPTLIPPRDLDSERVSPQAHVILSTPYVMAFLDILPIATGHILVTTRDHYKMLHDMYNPPASGDWTSRQAVAKSRETSRAIGEWLPIISRALCSVLQCEGWNVVQNNGEIAAQVVPHVHFHLIPRYQEGRRDIGGKGRVDVGMLKSWKMFGRGAREELDDDEGKELAAELREALRKEVARREGDEKPKL